MKRVKLFVKNNYIIIIPFLATLFLYFLNIVVHKIYPFGKETFIFSDMFEQYVSYFSYIKEAAFGRASIFSSFSFSLGQNFYGIFTYFCLSPLNILFLFSTKATIPIFVIIVVILKLGLASMNMAILLRSKLKNNVSIIIFSTIYGLISYNLVYATNVMWLDCVYLLPLVVLGLEKALNGKPILYIFALTLSICINYYISFSVCIFLIIYFIYYEILNKRNFIKDLFIFIKYSIISVLLCSVILIPTVFNMLSGKFANTGSNFSFKLDYDPKILIYKFLISDSKGVLGDYPHFTSSLLVLVLISTYLFNKNITIKNKITTFFTLALLIAITFFPATDTIMHCFKVPNQFTYRYAFLIAFFMILVASESFDNYKINTKNILVYLVVGALIYKYLTLCLDFRTIVSSIFVLLYFLGPTFIKDKKMLAVLFIPLVLIELFINTSSTYDLFKRTDFDDYSKLFKYDDDINKIKPKQNEFYRISGINKITFNDAFAYNYYGITSFSPTVTTNTNKFLKDYLGQPLYESYSIDYYNTTEFTDALLGVKYKYKIEDGKILVFESENVFPVLFKIEQNDRYKEESTKIENLNILYQYLSNSDDRIFDEFNDYLIEDCEFKDGKLINKDVCFCTFVTDDNIDNAYVEIASTNYLVMPVYNVSNGHICYSRYIILNLNHGARIHIDENETEVEYIKSYKMDKTKLKKLTEKLTENKVNITSHSQNKITGTINNELDNQIIFTTIPYDEGWHVTINGKEVKTFKNLDSLLAFELPKGEANIELIFVPVGFKIGLFISLFTFDLLVLIFVRKKNKGF